MGELLDARTSGVWVNLEVAGVSTGSSRYAAIASCSVEDRVSRSSYVGDSSRYLLGCNTVRFWQSSNHDRVMSL